MTIKELITALQAHPDQDVEVFVYDSDSGYPIEISGVDTTMNDRCDLNLTQEG